MTEKNKSQNELLRGHIRPKVEQKFDYSLSQNRKQDFDEVCKKFNLEPKKARFAYRLMLKEVLEEYGINPMTIGYGKRIKHKFWQEKNKEFQSQYQEVQKPTIQSVASGQELENPPITQEQKEDYEELKTQVQQVQKIYVFTEESLKQFWAGMWMILKLKWKLMEDLNEEEKNSLARMWRPAFQKWVPEWAVLLGIPSIITIGMLGKKIKQARDLRKQNQIQEKLEKMENKKSLTEDKNLESKSGMKWNEEKQVWEKQ